MTEKIEDFRSGYVAVIGRPNVGKSTLINALVGEKVSITSKKPQTTRDRIMGVLTTEDAQYIFVDTPGFQTKHSSELLDRMNKSVKSSLSDVDAVVMVIESTGWRPEDEEVLKLLPHDAKNVILAINKTDEVKESEVILPLIQESMKKFAFADVVPVSAEKNRQLDVLLQVIRKFLPEGDKLFEDDIYTDKSPRFLAAEIIREKAFRLLGDELPYGVAVMIDKWEENDQGARIFATLIVNRESHKGIVIGEKGSKLREISRLAREDISAMLGKKVYLEVWVRVRKGWGDDAAVLKSLGYE
ncbi:GTPase Era [Turicimonas muris]|uniref:GTPase Era n=2 Tax=Turicimonas muris TaxID=1796652 RepID=UPI001C3EB69F|nr:GTPase Era [Turicimonas muris]